MSIDIRPITPEEFEPFAAANATGFGFEFRPEAYEEIRRVLELDRTLAAFDGPEVAGTAAIFTLELTVPGSRLPAAGVTWVSVKPTHRRRGVLTGLMRRQLSDVRERGEALAALWASESVIYGRFGYGMASETVELEIAREHTAFARPLDGPGRARLVTRDDALRDWPAVYERVLPTRPGMFARSDVWWENVAMRVREHGQSGFSAPFYVQYEEDGNVLGYARYRNRGGSQDGVPSGTLAVQQLIAVDTAAYAALWRYLFGVDLMSTVQARLRPVDDPLPFMLADPRRLKRRPYDSLWVRIIDVPAALSGRRYASEGRLAFEVSDAFLGWTAGRYELEAAGEGALCRPTEREPELRLGVAELGAAYLGGVSLRVLERAGRVEGDAAALARADAMFRWDPAPWCPEVF